jgi:hypothetical protein
VTRRVLAALLLAASAWLWFGAAAPARRERDTARDEFARLRAERERVRLEVEASSRRASVALTPEKGAAAARALRRALLAAAEAAPVREVAIAASASPRGRAATGRLAAVGSLDELLVVADRLCDPASGVVIRRCVLSEAGAGGGALRLELEASSVGTGS